MKTLIAATCLAVLAAIGYFFWGECRAATEARARVDRVALAAKIADCRETLVAYKNGGAAGFQSPAAAENASRKCADFLNDFYGYEDNDKIHVDELGVYVGSLD